MLGGYSLSLADTHRDLDGFYRFSFAPSYSPPQVLASVLDADGVAAAYLDTRLKFFGEPNDTYFANQWNLTQIRASRAWEIAAGDSSIVAAVIDRGFQLDHEDLVESVWVSKCWDFDSNDNDPSPEAPGDKHGTACTGVAFASRDNGTGVAGIAGGSNGNRPRVVLLRVNYSSDLSPAFEYLLNLGVDVVSMSFGAGPQSGATCAAIDSAYARGTNFFAAIGNAGWGTAFTLFPATHPDVIAVGATDENDVLLCQSNYGQYLELMAPSAFTFERLAHRGVILHGH